MSYSLSSSIPEKTIKENFCMKFSNFYFGTFLDDNSFWLSIISFFIFVSFHFYSEVKHLNGLFDLTLFTLYSISSFMAIGSAGWLWSVKSGKMNGGGHVLRCKKWCKIIFAFLIFFCIFKTIFKTFFFFAFLKTITIVAWPKYQKSNKQA